MPVGTIFPPQFMSHVAQNRFGSRGAIQRRQRTQDDYGQEIVVYASDPLLVAIPCQVQPRTNRADAEVRTSNETTVTLVFDILLAGYYPTISEQDQISVSPQERAYNILKVAHDDTRTYTMLTAEVVNG